MAASEICARCGEEVRYGTRGLVTGYLHRLDVDHVPLFGAAQTPESLAAIEAELDKVRERFVPTDDGFPLLFTIETYTTREFDIAKDTDPARRRRRLALARGLDPDAPPPPIPAPEVARHDLDIKDFPGTSGIVQLYNLFAGITRVMPNGKSSKSQKHPPMAPGWAVRRFTGARGPYLGADGTVLSISDTVVLGAREVDSDRIAVASWRDGQFDTGYIGHLERGIARVEAATSTEMKAWIKEPPA